MTIGTRREVDTSIATAFARKFGQAGFGTRHNLVGNLPIITLICAPGVELPVVFHADDLPGLLFVPYRADSTLPRIDAVLEGCHIEVRRITIREDEYRMLMDGIAVDHDDLVLQVVNRCGIDADRDIDNIAD